MTDPFSKLEPGDLIEVPAGYVVAPLRQPLVRWEEKHGGHFDLIGTMFTIYVMEDDGTVMPFLDEVLA